MDIEKIKALAEEFGGWTEDNGGGYAFWNGQNGDCGPGGDLLLFVAAIRRETLLEAARVCDAEAAELAESCLDHMPEAVAERCAEAIKALIDPAPAS